MPGAPRDEQELGRTLTRWLTSRVDGDVAVTRIAAPGGGSSSETFLIDATITGPDEARRVNWVLRIEPTGFQVYQDAAVEKQFRVMELLGRISDVPVPATLWYESDPSLLGSPFFLMERVAGEAPPNDYHSSGVLAEATPAAREAMWRDGVRMLTRIHKLDPVPFAFLGRPDLGPTGFEQEIARWDRYREWTGLAAVDVLDRGRRWLDDNRPAPTPPGLAWGDARLGNFLFRDNACVSVLDWETASLGGAESDLGWWLYYDHVIAEGSGIPRLDGVGDRAATIALWEQEMGRKAQAIEWHEAFATWRFAWISERALALAEAAGIPMPIGRGHNNPAVRRMGELIA